MGFPAHCYPIAEWLQVVDDALRAGIGEGVVRVGSSLEGRLSSIDIMACRRASRSGLKAIIEEHALRGQAVHIRGISLALVAANIEVAKIVGQHENEIGFGGRVEGRD